VFRPAALALSAFWLGLLVASWVAATASFRTVDRVLGPGLRPELAARLEPLPPPARRETLRHLASEVNRWLFRHFGLLEGGLSLLLLALAWPGGGRGRVLAGAVVAIVLVQLMALGPRILEIGRAIDFVPRPLDPEVGRRFGMLHAAYVGLDLLKAGILAAVVWLTARA
jgi:hypothetical protein